MYIVHVEVHVKPEYVEAFEDATIENARNSVKEAGIARFDVLRKKDEPTRFLLVEVYRTSEDPARHKETEHYRRWRDAVADMMAEPRSSTVFDSIYPRDDGWD